MEINLANLEESVSKQNIIYFNSDHSKTQECSGQLAESMDLSWTLVSTWSELASALHQEDAILAVHIDMMSHGPVKSVIEFMDALATITKFMPCHGRLKIGVIITPTTPRSIIKDLQRSQCQGILLHVDDYTETEVNQSMRALGSGIPYWPKHILDQLPTSPPLSIYFRADWQTYITPEMYESVKKQGVFDVAYCSNWSELGQALERNPHQLIFHISMLERLEVSISEIMTMIQTKLKLARLDIPIGVGIDPDVNVSTIRELRRAGVFGLAFSSVHWGPEETKRGMLALRDREPYWPKHILDQLPGAKKKKANADNITLTLRQEQVFNHITERGSSNKAIAKSLGISESTVKLHLTEIFKKYGVRNRTQLAVFSNAS